MKKKDYCYRGHARIASNLSSNRTCLECAKINHRASYLSNYKQRLEYARMYSKNNPYKWKGWHLKKAYNITLSQYEDLKRRQNNQCAICDQVPERTLVVDHHHSSGKVRGLLCDVCNRIVLPVVERYSNLLGKADKYLYERSFNDAYTL